MLLHRRAPALFSFVFLLGVGTPALADIAPEKQDMPAEESKGKKGGDCSVDDSTLGLGGLAALALLISGVALRRRRA
jgi:hypothetical protein